MKKVETEEVSIRLAKAEDCGDMGQFFQSTQGGYKVLMVVRGKPGKSEDGIDIEIATENEMPASVLLMIRQSLDQHILAELLERSKPAQES